MSVRSTGGWTPSDDRGKAGVRIGQPQELIGEVRRWTWDEMKSLGSESVLGATGPMQQQASAGRPTQHEDAPDPHPPDSLPEAAKAVRSNETAITSVARAIKVR